MKKTMKMLGYSKEEENKKKRKMWIHHEGKHSMNLWYTD